jgi:hypothetical protein
VFGQHHSIPKNVEGFEDRFLSQAEYEFPAFGVGDE